MMTVERKEEDDSAGNSVARRHWLEARAGKRCWMKRARGGVLWVSLGDDGRGRRWQVMVGQMMVGAGARAPKVMA
jgi:hypothetical protein